MIIKQSLNRFVVAGCALVLCSCAAAPEAVTLATKTNAAASALNKQLINYEAQMKGYTAVRALSIEANLQNVQDRGQQISDSVHLWRLEGSSVALGLFQNLQASRPALNPVSVTLDLGSRSSGGRGSSLYDPKPIEETIKKVEALTKSKSVLGSLEYVGGYLEGIQTKVQEKQKEAEDALNESENTGSNS